jgi:AbiV family abortive infection protein
VPQPAKFQQPNPADIQASIGACLANGERLLDDAMMLEFQEPASTRLMVSMLAQEEFAKAFLLFLVKQEIIPWDSELLRAMNNHSCKQLVAIVIEYLDPQWETLDELTKMLDAEYALDGAFPKPVSSALNILYHEKMQRGDFSDDNDYDPQVVNVATGERDKVKQNAVYVRIDRSGRVQSTPSSVTMDAANEEYEKARRYRWFVGSLASDGPRDSEQFRKLREAMKIVYWQKYKPISFPSEARDNNETK